MNNLVNMSFVGLIFFNIFSLNFLTALALLFLGVLSKFMVVNKHITLMLLYLETLTLIMILFLGLSQTVFKSMALFYIFVVLSVGEAVIGLSILVKVTRQSSRENLNSKMV